METLILKPFNYSVKVLTSLIVFALCCIGGDRGEKALANQLTQDTPKLNLFVLSLFFLLLWSGCKESDDPNPDTQAPTITGFSPTSGTAGTTVTITGTNFSTTAASNTVKFNGTSASVSAATATGLTVSVPAGGSTGKITVQIDSRTATSTEDFVYESAGSLSTVSTLAGSGVAGFADGSGTAAQFDTPSDVAVDASGNIYVADRSNMRIRKITPNGVVSTLAGSGTLGFANGNGTTAKFSLPNGVAVDASGNVYVADFENDLIRKITPDGEVSTLAGSGTPGFADGNATSAQFNGPGKLAVDASGNVYVSDTGNDRIRKVAPNGEVSTLAGSGTSGFADGPGNVAQFSSLGGIAVDASGNVYVGDHRRLRKITPNGEVSTLAGSGVLGFADGSGTAAKFSGVTGVAVDPSGNIYVGDPLNNRIRKITPNGDVSTLAGSGNSGFVDGSGTTAQFALPQGVALDAEGNVYVADQVNNRIRKIQ